MYMYMLLFGEANYVLIDAHLAWLTQVETCMHNYSVAPREY